MKKRTKIIIGSIVGICIVCISILLLSNIEGIENTEETLIDCGNGYFVEYCEPLDNWDVHDGTYIYGSFSDKDSAIYYAKNLT